MGSGDEPTMTAAGAGAPTAAPSPGDAVGRYVLDRVLGAGGMGVVYAAHDPDLERAVALKLLRAGRDDAQARARLLREARAMAKLSHPNVIVVHEVGTAAGRDFVAMELIDGVDVNQWLGERKRPPAEVMPVLVAAGRGLAAAHRAGLVHRDFKPHNVLRGRDGRVVVTDFGLARGIDSPGLAAPPRGQSPQGPHPAQSSGTSAEVGLEETVEASQTPRPATGSLSSTLTATGAMLGTPAYMAPEQFLGGATGPETDQFAYCVTAWEALAGQRPFRGGNVEELRRSVLRGVTEPAPALPRRLRVVLERGLREDPAARWPSMDALLDALDAAVRRPRRIALAVGGLALAGVATAAIVLTRGGAPAASACKSADALLAGAWSSDERATMERQFASEPVGLTRIRDALDGWVVRWRELYDAACAKPKAPEFHARVACLINARDELAALVSMAEGAPPEMVRGVHLADVLTPADGCDTPMGRNVPPPPSDPQVAEQVRALRQRTAVARVQAGTGRARDAISEIEQIVTEARALGWGPAIADAVYSRAVILHIAGDLDAAEFAYEDASTEAEAAGDDPKRAAALVGYLEVVVARTLDGPRVRSIAKRALAAIERAGDDPVLRASVDVNLAGIDEADGNLDVAIARVESARAVFARVGDRRRSANTAGALAWLHLVRAGDGDAAAAEALTREALALQLEIVGPEHPRTLEAIEELAALRWEAGDLDEAHALYDRLRAAPREPPTPLQPMRGRVVDADGHGVASATVYVGTALLVDPHTLSVPIRELWLAEATTGPDGAFSIEAPAQAVAIAEHGAARSFPRGFAAGAVELVLGPTVEVRGRLRFEGALVEGREPASVAARRIVSRDAGLQVFIGSMGVTLRAPRDADGAWVLPGVPVGDYVATASVTTGLGDHRMFQRAVKIGAGNAPIELAVTRDGRILDVIVRVDRAATLASAQVMVLPGATTATTASVLIEAILRAQTMGTAFAVPVDERGQTEVGSALYVPGDLHARVSMVTPGETSLCVVPFDRDVGDKEALREIMARRTELEVVCQTVTVAATPVIQAFVVEVAPAKRLPR